MAATARPTLGSTTLLRWCESRRGNAALLADACGVRGAAAYKWARGLAVPSAANRRRIEQVTRVVRASMWDVPK